MATVFGVSPSPFVRKVRVYLAEKGIAYDLQPVPPFPPANDDPEFRRKSPLGKIPAFEDGDFAISDSSVICAYLERKNPSPPLYPENDEQFARALWFEELADSKLAEGCGAVFFQRKVVPTFMGGDTDEAAVQTALTETLPPLLDYLEGQLADADYFVGGRFSIADVSVATQLQQLRHGGEDVDIDRWPKLAAFADRVLSRPSFKACIEEDSQFFGG